MRNLLLSTTAVIALNALLGFAGTAHAQGQSVPPSQAQGVTSPVQDVVKPGEMAKPPEQVAKPEQIARPEQAVQPEKIAPPAQAAKPEPVTKSEQSAAQPEKASPLATPEHQRQGDEAVNSASGRAGKSEPSSEAATPDPRLSGPVFVNGALNVPGAPEDSQTVPAKFSERNDRIDKLPTMAMPIGLSDAQKQSIMASATKANAPVTKIDAKITEELPSTVVLHDLPPGADMPGVKYLRLKDRILLVRVPTNIVVGEIVN